MNPEDFSKKGENIQIFKNLGNNFAYLLENFKL
jgi:hypothetical protein